MSTTREPALISASRWSTETRSSGYRAAAKSSSIVATFQSYPVGPPVLEPGTNRSRVLAASDQAERTGPSRHCASPIESSTGCKARLTLRDE